MPAVAALSKEPEKRPHRKQHVLHALLYSLRSQMTSHAHSDPIYSRGRRLGVRQGTLRQGPLVTTCRGSKVGPWGVRARALTHHAVQPTGPCGRGESDTREIESLAQLAAKPLPGEEDRCPALVLQFTWGENTVQSAYETRSPQASLNRDSQPLRPRRLSRKN